MGRGPPAASPASAATPAAAAPRRRPVEGQGPTGRHSLSRPRPGGVTDRRDHRPERGPPPRPGDGGQKARTSPGRHCPAPAPPPRGSPTAATTAPSGTAASAAPAGRPGAGRLPHRGEGRPTPPCPGATARDGASRASPGVVSVRRTSAAEGTGCRIRLEHHERFADL
ncbi:hypothetical protein B1H29_28480 [Streptomyces pactum]|uniref:Uncharacterized protein n=1 Tax=Streptomyces pactum TaxID=68249 RepID=A0A1S6JF16_9ACTN|nr:hypothetical protein B1H29_28480 [Streptomyces pactum]